LLSFAECRANFSNNSFPALKNDFCLPEVIFFIRYSFLIAPSLSLLFTGLTNQWINFLIVFFMLNKTKGSESSTTGKWEYRLRSGEMVWSDEMYRIFEVQPKSQDLLLEEIHLLLDEAEKEKNIGFAINRIRQGKPFHYQQNLRFHDGRNKTILVSGSPFADISGIPELIKGTCEDITQPGLSELQRFFELSSDLLCITDREGNILSNSLSIHKLPGCKGGNLRGQNLLDILHPHEPDDFRNSLKLLFNSGRTENQESRFVLLNGKSVVLQWTANLDAVSNRIFISARDVTGKAELASLILKNKIEAGKARAKDIFLANMSHEIRTPLNAIIGFNEILSKSGLTSDQQKKVAIIQTASRTLSVIINDILDLSKLESGKLELDVKPFQPEQICKQVIHLQSSTARNKGVKLFFSYDNDIPETLLGDDVRLTQILINLISNAIKFTEKGHVELKVKEVLRQGNQSEIAFRITDTGIGIPKDRIKKIFRRFTQAESYTTRLYGGTGLGLSIVKSLIKLHNGKLSVKSNEGLGSVFSFSIRFEVYEGVPFSADQPGDGDEMQEEILRNTRMLIVEDNEHNQMLACSYLERYGLQLELASNGRQALEILKEKEFDLILMDIQMPLLDGISTAIRIRNELRLDTPVIACSAHAMASERRKCLESGMNDYITKPYSEAILLGVIRKFIPLKENQSENNDSDRGGLVMAAEMSPEFPASGSSKLEKSIIAKIPADIRIIDEALQRKDWGELEFKAHHLISSLAVLKLDEGIGLTRKLENAAHEKKMDDAMRLSHELIEYLRLVCVDAPRINSGF
jgi:PAS domain S-box-containing protein